MQLTKRLWAPCHGPCRGRRRVALCLAKARDFQREVVVGIDLGTTNSAVAFIEGGKPKCIPNADGETITPSVVSVLKDGEVVVGRRAQRQAVLHPSTTYYSVKRLIGRRFDDPAVKEEASRLPYKVAADEDGSVVLDCPNVGPGYLYPEEVSAQVIGQLVSDAAAHTCGKVTKAVIAVPAYFDDRQREATVAAGKLAGLETVRLLREPVAAALAYGLDLRQDATVLVFDLGGGTYDVSLLEVGNGTIEVLSTGGDAHLGGDDWDAAISDWITATYLRPAGLDPAADPRLRTNLRALAQSAKHSLSDNEEVVLRMPVGGPGGGPLEARLTREALDSQLSQELWRRCRLPLDQACWQAGVDLNEVVGGHDALKQQLRSRGVPAWKVESMQPEIRPRKRQPLSAVLLVGGATRMPAVGRFIANMTGLQPLEAALDPDEAVALGAAVQAGILQGEISNLMVMDQWQASLMRALAKMQLRSDPRVRDRVEQTYSLEDEGEDAADESAQGSGSDGEAAGEEGAGKGKPLSKRQKRRQKAAKEAVKGAGKGTVQGAAKDPAADGQGAGPKGGKGNTDQNATDTAPPGSKLPCQPSSRDCSRAVLKAHPITCSTESSYSSSSSHWSHGPSRYEVTADAASPEPDLPDAPSWHYSSSDESSRHDSSASEPSRVVSSPCEALLPRTVTPHTLTPPLAWSGSTELEEQTATPEQPSLSSFPAPADGICSDTSTPITTSPSASFCASFPSTAHAQAEVQGLREQLAELQDRLEQEQATSASLRASLAAATTRIPATAADLAAENRQLQAALAALRAGSCATLAAMQAEVDSLTKQCGLAAATLSHSRSKAEKLERQLTAIRTAAYGLSNRSIQDMVELGMGVTEAQDRMAAAVGCSSLEELVALQPVEAFKKPCASDHSAVVCVEDPVLAATLAARAARRAASAQAGDAMLTSAPAAPLRGGRAEVVAQGAELAASLPGSLAAELPTSARLVLKILPFFSASTAAVINATAANSTCSAATAAAPSRQAKQLPSLQDVLPEVTADSVLSALLPGEYATPLLWGTMELCGPCARCPGPDRQLVIVYAHEEAGDLIERLGAQVGAACAALAEAQQRVAEAEAALAAHATQPQAPPLDAFMASVQRLRPGPGSGSGPCPSASPSALESEAQRQAVAAAEAAVEAARASLEAAKPQAARELVAGLAHMVQGMCRVAAKVHGLGLHVDDIKPENFVFTCSGRVKGIDAGSIRQAQEGHGCEASSPGSGTYTQGYAAPEQSPGPGQGQGRSGAAADVWALGRSAKALLKQMVWELNEAGASALLPALEAAFDASPLPDVVSACCQRDPSMRLTAGELLRMLL
ncbi:hypothetical protein HYH03_006278 [Edaphochlamys debaryana]|uniref:Protein kinase domain-containing protein n=1 Tax=Edaphochlamys debaryana TaxID=47281 RepID=A0A835Y4A0_9CHLO|nr:hypothetical protein HYH03_006278 [Edaphochlamys debaryana]|eukprot:KAG2495678.1 hypothetical protein HYH03_006278 [Edaphochlamys debaryana]